MAEVVCTAENTRPAPGEWTDLVAFTQGQMDQCDAEVPSDEVISSVFSAVRDLDNEDYDSARFYGLGLVMCGVARRLRQPEIRGELINAAADGLLALRRATGVFDECGMCMGNIRGHRINTMFENITLEASGDLSPAERLVADILNADKDRRVELVKFQSMSDYSSHYDPLKFCRPDNIRKGDLSAKRVKNNASSATVTVIRVAAEKLFARHPQEEVEDYDTPENANEALATPYLEMMTEQRAALDALTQRLAVLRQDEFLQYVREFIDIDEAGDLVFVRERMVPLRDLGQPEIFFNGQSPVVVLHNKRLKCPAVFIEGLISTMIDVVVEAAMVAQRRIEARFKEDERMFGAHTVTRQYPLSRLGSMAESHS